MIQRRKLGFIIAIVPFLMATAIFAVSTNAVSEGGSDPSEMQREKDGSVSKAEFMKHHQWMFEQNDTNKNGYLDINEMKSLHIMVKKMHERFDERVGQKY